MKNTVSFFKKSTHSSQSTPAIFFSILCASLFIHLLCMTQAKLLVEEAYYWNYSQHLDWSYLDHPPMVALLIKIFTDLLGTSEFAVRAASLFCWFITGFFSYKLCELIQKQSGRNAILLLATLPFFFFQSIVITPDVPLIASWSACLYFLYRALVMNKAASWYGAGLCLGLGLLSKYTIVLVALAAFCYVICQKKSRFWLKKKEPYLGLLLAFIVFTPVLYWNAQHGWVSFIFQSSRRFNSITSLNIHNLAWMVLFFITPIGVWGLFELGKQNEQLIKISSDEKRFLQYFTFTPLLFFAVYSLNHGVNFNWSGPLFLALVPWLALLISNDSFKKNLWFGTSLVLLMIYSAVLLTVDLNKSDFIQHKILIKVIAWDDLIKKFNALAEAEEQRNHRPVIFVPLDNYPINSELAFYQQVLFNNGLIKKAYPATGAHIFDRESLMYRYWAKDENLADAQLILISKEAWRFDDPGVTQGLDSSSKLQQIWSLGQGQQLKNIPFYYKVARLKSKNSGDVLEPWSKATLKKDL